MTVRWPWRRGPKLGPLISAADRAMAERRWRDAVPLYEQVLSHRPGMAAIRIQLAHACKELGWLDAAASHYTEAARSQPEGIDALLHLGHMARAARDPLRAAEWYRKALAVDPASEAALAGIDAAVSGTMPVDRRRRIESNHFTSAPEADCRIHWDLTPPVRPDFDPEWLWFAELGRALAERGEVVPVRFDPRRGVYERCRADAARADATVAVTPASTSLFVTVTGRGAGRFEMARAIGQAQVQLRARVVTLARSGVVAARAGGSGDALLIADSSCVLASPRNAALLRDNQWRLGASAEAVVALDQPEPPQRPAEHDRAPVQRDGLLVALNPEPRALAELDARFTALGASGGRRLGIVAAPGHAREAALAKFCVRHRIEMVESRGIWDELSASHIGTLLIAGGYAAGDLWAERALRHGLAVIASVHDAAVRDAVGGLATYPAPGATHAEWQITAPIRDSAAAWLAPRTDSSQFGAARIEPWLAALDELRKSDRLGELPMRPLRRLIEFGRFYPLPAEAGAAARAGRADGAYLAAGSGWRSDGDAAAGRGAREIRIFGSGAPADPLVCRVMLRRPAAPAGSANAVDWLTLCAEPVIGGSGTNGVESVFALEPALSKRPDVEVAGFVFHPRSEDHHWFEFVDRLSRRIEPVEVYA